MNDSDGLLPDELLDEALASLRSVTPPEELHEANLAAVHQALMHGIEPVWWRRSVEVPVPVAIAASVAFVLTTTALLRSGAMPEEIQQVSPGPKLAVLVVDDADSNFDVYDEAGPNWNVTWSYIHSLESFANSKVNRLPDTEEKQDDS